MAAKRPLRSVAFDGRGKEMRRGAAANLYGAVNSAVKRLQLNQDGMMDVDITNGGEKPLAFVYRMKHRGDITVEYTPDGRKMLRKERGRMFRGR